MADNEKAVATHSVTGEDVNPATISSGGHLQLPDNWKYRSRKIGRWTIPWYASPESQLILISFVCFLCPGMFNALNGLGAGGQFNTATGDDANTALYSCFAVVGFFAGSITNRLGIRWTLALGGIGYPVYVSGYLCYNYTANLGYVVFTGALLGVCAGMLWSAQGAILLSYPPEHQKGRYIAIFWVIFNLGAVIGALVSLGTNINDKAAGSVSNGTYIGFLCLTFFGACLCLTLCQGDSVIRRDGSKVILMKHPTWQSEFVGLWTTMKTDYYIVLLFPMFLASNWFYAYQFNDFNAVRFNVRTRSLNNTLYWLSQMIGAAIWGFVLDAPWLRRTTRAFGAWALLLAITMAIWGGGYVFEKKFTRFDAAKKDFFVYDWTTPGYVGPMFLYIFYGMYDAIWQTTIYWFMGAISNNGRKLANFVGFYKGIQSAGGAITWRLDGIKTPYAGMFGSTWGLLAGSLVVALPVMIWKIKDTTSFERDLAFSDETADDVLAHKTIEDGTPTRELSTVGDVKA